MLGIGPGGRGGPGHRGGGPAFFRGGPFGDVLGAVGTALGLTRDELHDRLHDGRSIADIAKAQGKDVDDVKAAAKAAITKELAEAVKDERLTDAQRDEIAARLDEHLDRFAERGFEGRRGFRGFRGPRP